MLPGNDCNYKDVTYWNERYKTEQQYDWFKSYKDFQNLIHEHVPATAKILMLGCGNSTLSEEMYNDGYCDIVNIDYSSVVIENMKAKSEVTKKMEWHVMDMTKLQFTAETFDIVIEKGTFDAVMAGETDLWNITDATKDVVRSALREISRVLKHNGKLISITFAQPHFRLPLYSEVEYGWDVNHSTFGDYFHYFFCVMTKGKKLKCAVIHKNTQRNEKTIYLEDTNDNFLFNVDIDDL